jgi:predicted NAD/FAD-binding protein
MLNGRVVDTSSLELEGIDGRDAPDFCDAYFSAGLWQDGTKMSDEDLDALKESHPDLFYDRVYHHASD